MIGSGEDSHRYYLQIGESLERLAMGSNGSFQGRPFERRVDISHKNSAPLRLCVRFLSLYMRQKNRNRSRGSLDVGKVSIISCIIALACLYYSND